MAFCENCGNQMSDQAVACPNCGHPGPGARTQAVATGADMSAIGRPYASWGKRVGAAIIDGIIISIPAYIIMGIFSFGFLASNKLHVDSEGRLVGGGGAFAGLIGAMLMFAIAAILYRAFLDGGPKGQTVGKMALKIQVRDEATGGSIGYGRGALRWSIPALVSIIPIIGFLVVLVDVLFPLWDPKKQAIHDKVAKSIVVDAP